jgi:hypothetical protein
LAISEGLGQALDLDQSGHFRALLASIPWMGVPFRPTPRGPSWGDPDGLT